MKQKPMSRLTQLFKNVFGLPQPSVAVVSYNKIRHLPNGIHRILGIVVMISGKIFSPKSIKTVSADHYQFQQLIKYKYSLEKIIIFIGKKDSGSIAMIDLFCKEFNDVAYILCFVSCHHDWEEKLSTLEFHRIPTTHYSYHEDCHVRFTDPSDQCREGPWLLGYLFDYILGKKNYQPD